VGKIEKTEFRDITGNSEDGYSARFRFRLTPPGSEHTFTVSVSGSVTAPLGLGRGGAGGDHPKVMVAMEKAVKARINDDPRHKLPAEESLVLEKRDIKPFV
jgi:hypothetical protein